MLNTVTLAGPYPEEVPGLLRSELPGELEIRAVKDQAALDALTDMELVILRTLKVDGTLITANPSLKLIQRWGAGFDTVDIETAGRNRVPVAVAASVNSCAVAEHAILLMLASLRNLVALDANTKKGIWDRAAFAPRSFMISDKQVGLIGCGAIGRLVAKKARALDAHVQYYDAFRLPEEVEKGLGLNYVDFGTLLETSDIISLHLPLTEGTKLIIGEKELARMKKGAILVNTSRGGLIDEAGLAAALREGRLLAAALDSFSEEPYPADGPLHGVENLIMTPHIGGTVVDLTLPMVRKVAENILKVYRGQPLPRRDMVNSGLCPYPVE
jgi:phosphoglycerate dehydrogenase-like enzyme